MLDGILGRGFAARSKSLIKLTKSRIDVIRRKRNATLKFLKKDIADLLANGLDVNAFGRAEGFLAELKVSWCYDFVENCCDFVLKHLSVLQKLRDCPEDCREAISSLMFAAARFSDLPELRDLRDNFLERYGNSLELFVSQQFVENLGSKPFSLEKKVMLLQEIAIEFTIRWDSRAFEKRMSKDSKPAVVPEGQKRTYGSLHVNEEKSKTNAAYAQENKSSFSNKEKLEVGFNGHQSRSAKEDNSSKRKETNLQYRQEPAVEGHKSINTRTVKDNHDMSQWGKKEVSAGKHEVWNGKEDITSTKVRSHGRSIDGNGGIEGDFSKRNEANHQSRPESSFEGYKLPNGGEGKDNHDELLWRRKEVSAGKYEFRDGKEDIMSSKGRKSSSSHGRSSDGAKLPEFWEKNDRRADRRDILFQGKEPSPSFEGSKYNIRDNGPFAGDNLPVNDTARAREDTPRLKPHHNGVLPPPYVKPNTKPKDSKHGASSSLGSFSDLDDNLLARDPFEPRKDRAGNRPDQNQERLDNVDIQKPIFSPARVNSHSREKDHYPRNNGIDNPIPKPRSSRRRHAKSVPSQDDSDHNEHPEATVRRKSRSRRRDDPRRGLQILFDDEHPQNDDEEKIIDKLLIHYSKKPTSFEEGKARRKPSRSRRAGEAPSNISADEISEVPAPARSQSLPPEPITEPQAKVFTRAASFQPDRHVHPKLPDYDDLAARFAALRGR